MLKIFKYIYRSLGLKKISKLNYFISYYFFNFEKTKKEFLIKKTNFNKRDREKIIEFKNKYKDECCVIIGNGPSLNNTDLSKLHNVKTFGVNSIFLMTEKNLFKPSFYMVEDRLVVKHNLEEIKNYDVEFKFFPHFYKNELKKIDPYFFNLDSRFYRSEYNIPKKTNIKFSNNFSKVAYAGQTVTYLNLQLAYYMGFSEIYLIGVDFNYVLPDNVIKNGNVWKSYGDDPNHFDKRYFGKGKESNDPQLHKTILAYKEAKHFFKKEKRKVINLTKGGKLEVFDRLNYDDVFK